MKIKSLSSALALGLGLTLTLLWLLSSNPLTIRAADLTVCAGVGCDFETIQAAVDAAAAGDVVKVAEGTYTDLHARDGITQVVYISKTVAIRGGYTTAFTEPPDPIAHPTTVDASGLGRGLVISGPVTVTVEGLRITGGDATGLGGSPDGWDAGGGVYVNTATAILNDCLIHDNTASRTDSYAYGGGVYLHYGIATLASNTIQGNTADAGSSGYGLGGGLALWNNPAMLTGNTIQNNTAAVLSAPFGEGGGIYMVYGQGAVVSGNVISGNVAGHEGHGGGLYLLHSPATLNDNQVLSNTASTGGTRSGRGGGLLLSSSDATLNRNLVQGNLAGAVSPGDGGGLFLDGSDAHLNDNLVVGNTARDGWWGGGGIVVNESDPTLTNTVVARNVIVGDGKGAGICTRMANSHLAYTTLADNSGGDGSGICVKSSSTATFIDTILANQTVGITVTAGCSADLEATLWYNNGTNTGGAGNIVTGAVNVSGDPAFVNPAGGDYHIGPTSAAIDKGVDAGADDDMDGDSRPQGGGYDIGADERVSAGLSADFSIGKVASAGAVIAGERITYTLTITNAGPDGPAAARVVDTFTPADAVDSVNWSGGSCTYAAGVADCAVGNVLIATPSTLEVYVMTSNAYSGTLSNTAVVTGDGSTVDPNGSNNSTGPVAVAVRLLTADLDITKSAYASEATAGEIITYALTITNGGPDSPAIARVVDTLEPPVAVDGVSWAGGSCAYADGVVQCTVENVQTAAPSTLKLYVTTIAAYSGTLTNTVTVTGSGVTVDPNVSNNSAGPVWVAVHTPAPPPPTEHTVCPGGGCDFETIQAAVDAANPCSNDVIKVAEGTYTDLHMRDNITQVVYVSKTVAIRGGYTTAFTEPPDPVAHPATLDAGGLGRGLVVSATMLPCKFAPTMEGLRITGGDATGLGGNPDGWDAGGGVYVSVNAYAAQATISQCVITGNVATTDGVGQGGGLYLSGQDATLSSNTISGNAAAVGSWNTGEGGGLYLRTSDATLTGNTIQSNTGISGTDGWGRGGGVYLFYGASTLNDNLILDNVASEGTKWGHGGGLFLNNSPATLNGNVIQDNVAGTGGNGYYFGGGAYLLYSDATLNDNQLLDNVASSSPDSTSGTGGGLYSWYGDVILNGNRVQGNIASRHNYSSGSGGGLYLDHYTALLNANTIVDNTGGGIASERCNAVLTNTIVAGNLISGTRVEREEGAGMRIGGGHVALVHSTIAGNSGGAGSGVKVSAGAQVTMVNTILVNHTTGLTVTAGSTVTLNTTLWYGNGTDYGGPGSVTTGGDINGHDPLLDVTYHLRAGSPAIDQGVNAGVTTDVDGDLRPQGGGYDIGADERMIPIVTDLSIGKAANSDSVTAGRSITYTLTITNHGPEGPASAWVVDTLDPAAAVADVRWPGQVCSRQGVVISCLVENVSTATLTTLGLIVTTQDTYSDTLSNTAVITGVAGTVDGNASNNNAGPVIVAVVSSPPSVIYLPLVLRNYGP